MESLLQTKGLTDDQDPSVRVLAVVGSDLYVGGDFAETGDGTLTNLGSIIRYDTTTGTWHALHKPNRGCALDCTCGQCANRPCGRCPSASSVLYCKQY
jgi:hypothetical protein